MGGFKGVPRGSPQKDMPNILHIRIMHFTFGLGAKAEVIMTAPYMAGFISPASTRGPSFWEPKRKHDDGSVFDGMTFILHVGIDLGNLYH